MSNIFVLRWYVWMNLLPHVFESRASDMAGFVYRYHTIYDETEISQISQTDVVYRVRWKSLLNWKNEMKTVIGLVCPYPWMIIYTILHHQQVLNPKKKGKKKKYVNSGTVSPPTIICNLFYILLNVKVYDHFINLCTSYKVVTRYLIYFFSFTSVSVFMCVCLCLPGNSVVFQSGVWTHLCWFHSWRVSDRQTFMLSCKLIYIIFIYPIHIVIGFNYATNLFSWLFLIIMCWHDNKHADCFILIHILCWQDTVELYSGYRFHSI